MIEWPLPQNSAHWPWKVPVWSAVNQVSVVRPGITSTFWASSGLPVVDDVAGGQLQHHRLADRHDQRVGLLGNFVPSLYSNSQPNWKAVPSTVMSASGWSLTSPMFEIV